MWIAQLIFGLLLILAALGMLLVRTPVYAALSFLLALVLLAGHYLELSADFIAIMQVLIYAGAILVMFMFVIVLFQDAHQQLSKYKPKSNRVLLTVAALSFLAAMGFLATQFKGLSVQQERVPSGFGTVESIGKALYVDYFFPFEAIILLFLIAAVGALYLGRKSA